MSLQDFIEKFASQFDVPSLYEFEAGTEFKALEEWSSLMALSVIAMVDEEFGVALKGKDIRESKTIEDLFIIVKSLL